MFLNDLEDLKMDYFKNMVSSYHEILNFVISLVLLVKIDIIMAITIIIFSVVQLAVPFIFEKLIEKRQEELMNIRNEYTSSLQEFVNNFNLIKFFKREIIFQKINQDKSIEYRNASNTKETLSKTIYVLSFASSLAMYLGCMLVGIWLVFKDRITIGQVIESIMTSFKSSKPVQNKIMNFISEERSVEVEDEFEFNNLKLNNISFKYPTSDKYVLKNLDFTFEKGKKYIIIGESGTGKSTIFKILQKQEIATEGEVQLNNKNILDITDSTYYSKIGFATQDTGIFTASIKNNISLFDNKPVDKTIIEQLGLNTLINSKPKGIDTVISSEDKSISGGEKQRIAIARLLNENFDCILLDESTSSLYKNSVDIVEECILSKKDLTVIAITHHLTSKAIEMSDCILKLENGKLVPVTM